MATPGLVSATPWNHVDSSHSTPFETASKTATANYQLSSASLLSENKFGEYQYPLECDTTSQTYNALSEHLAIQDWLKRSASAADSDLSALTSVDKPTFTADIVIKFDGAGSFTYNYPFGTDFLGFMGSYSIDEKLEIALLKSPTITDFSKVRTLPLTAPYKDGIVAIGQGPVGHISEDAKTKLDQLQLEQVLRNLQLSVPTRR